MTKKYGRSLWLPCPVCGSKSRIKVYEDTILVNFPFFCPWCNREIRIDVVQLKTVLSNEPDV